MLKAMLVPIVCAVVVSYIVDPSRMMMPSRMLTPVVLGSVSSPVPLSSDSELVMDLITKILQRKTDGGDVRSSPRKPRPSGSDKPFSRTNRVEGQMKWVHELSYMLRAKNAADRQVVDIMTNGRTLLDSTLGPAVIVDLAKELLYSGIPEQVLQLYGAYCDLILHDEVVKDADPTVINSKVVANVVPLPVVPDSKLLAVISRAFIAMHDVKGALSLLQSSSRRGVLFDDEAKSLLMADLAQCSAEGLSAALQLRQQMMDRAEAVGAKGSAGILRGLHMHVLSSYEEEETGAASQRGVSARTLLVDASAKPADVFVNEEEHVKKMNASTAEAIAIDVADRYFHRSERQQQQQLGRPRHHHSVSIELLRVVFRSSVVLKDSSSSSASAQSKPRDSSSSRLRYSIIDFELDKGVDREERALAGLHAALSIMQRYGLRWDQQIADTLLDECLRVGDVTGMRFVAQRMWEEGISVRTSTCNALLRRYAEDGDAEGAYSLVHGVMRNSSLGTRSSVDVQLTAPNPETWTLLLQACLPTRKGRFVGKTVIDDLLPTDEATSSSRVTVITKEQWDLILEHSVLSAGDRQLVEQPQRTALLPDYSAVLCRMVAARCQPDDSSMRALYRSFLRTRDVESAMHLYRMQLQGEQVRASFWAIATKQLSSIASNQAAVEHSATERRVLTMYQNYSSLLLKVSNNYSYSCHGESEEENALTLSEQKMQLEMLVSMCLPPLSIGSINALLELLSMHGHYSRARSVLRDICTRAKQPKPPRPSSNGSSSESLLASPQLLPDRASFALVIEACLRDSEHPADSSSSRDVSSSPQLPPSPPPNRLPVILNLVRTMETDFGLRPDRRIYAALIRAFGQRGDASSALGVFQEMRQYYFPDVGTLQSILDVCLQDPTGADLLRMCPVLEDMAEQRGLQLEVYSKDVLMEGFPDGQSLGAALLAMEATTRPGPQPCAEVSLCVLSVLTQAVRSSFSVGSSSSAKALQLELESSLAVLGAAGIRLEKETREYFRIPEEPALNSPNSRHYHRLFVPQKRKQRSLLDIDMPLGLRPDLDVPLRGYNPVRDAAPRVELEGRWSGHAKTMAALLDGAVYEAEQFAIEEEARSSSSSSEEEDEDEESVVDSSSSSKNALASVDGDSDVVAQPAEVLLSQVVVERKRDRHVSNDLRDAFKQQIKPPKRTAIDMWVPKAAAAAASLRKEKSQSRDRGRTITNDSPRPPSDAARKGQLLLESRKHLEAEQQQQRVRAPTTLKQSSSSGVKAVVMNSKSRSSS